MDTQVTNDFNRLSTIFFFKDDCRIEYIADLKENGKKEKREARNAGTLRVGKDKFCSTFKEEKSHTAMDFELQRLMKTQNCLND